MIAGVIAIFAFDTAFEIFHQLFFPSGSYLFDPTTDRLVQLFPFALWSETTMALGLVIIALAFALAVFAGPRTRPAVHGTTEKQSLQSPGPEPAA